MQSGDTPLVTPKGFNPTNTGYNPVILITPKGLNPTTPGCNPVMSPLNSSLLTWESDLLSQNHYAAFFFQRQRCQHDSSHAG
jgi:hypothetical protein